MSKSDGAPRWAMAIDLSTRQDEGNGYVLVSRGADENAEAANKPSQGILFSMNLLRSIPGDEGKEERNE